MIGSFDDGSKFLTAATPSLVLSRAAGASVKGRGRLVYNSARCPIKTNGGALASVSFINRCVGVRPPLVTVAEFQHLANVGQFNVHCRSARSILIESCENEERARARSAYRLHLPICPDPFLSRLGIWEGMTRGWWCNGQFDRILFFFSFFLQIIFRCNRQSDTDATRRVGLRRKCNVYKSLRSVNEMSITCGDEWDCLATRHSWLSANCACAYI